MNANETPFLDEESMLALLVAYRARPATVGELRKLLQPASVARLDVTLAALESAGFLTENDGRLTLESPYAAYIAISQARMERLQSETERTVTLMSSLPQLIRNWDLGEAGPGEQHPLVARIVHGHDDRWPVWREHLAKRAPARPSWVLPDPGMLREMFAAHADGIAALLGDGRMRPRILVRPEAIADPANQPLVAAAPALGVEVRVLDDLPGWFYVDDGHLAGLPVTWGEIAPPSILLISTPPIIAVLGVVFDTLWSRAEPAIAESPGWEPVVRLLAQGLTDEAVARFLGLDVRTVRRRVADAMSELGATSRFALGMAWGRRAP